MRLQEIGRLLNSYKVIVNKSTVPVGTAKKVKKDISENYKGQFDVVSNPEFLREGVAVDDFMKPERVVVGTSSEKAISIMKKLYAPFIRQGNPIIFMSEESSELTKYAANSFLATKISFMNEISHLCEKLGANVDMVRKGIGTDSRIGKRFLFPGIGYGGSCFPKDVKALLKSSKDVDYEFKILAAVEEINEIQKLHLTKKIFKYFKKLDGLRFALWGLSFKPKTDDIREAPALKIINELLIKGSKIIAYDPEATKNVKSKIGDKIDYAENKYDALKDVDALIIATEWPEFLTPDFKKIEGLMKNKLIFDGRNLYNVEDIASLGLNIIV